MAIVRWIWRRFEDVEPTDPSASRPWPRRRGPVHRTATAVLSLALTLSTVTACADQAEEVSVTTESGEELVVDWDEGLTYEEQVAEIKLVNEVMTKHFGEKVLPSIDGAEWDLQTYLSQPGLPYPSSRADDHYYFGVKYEFSDVKASQETQEKALAVLDELGLTPNEDLPTTYGEDRRRPVYVAGGEDEHGRIFLIRQLGDGAGITARYWARHSDHESMREAYEVNMVDSVK